MPPKQVSALTQALQQSRHEHPTATHRRLSIYPTDSPATTDPQPSADLLSHARRQSSAKAQSDRSTLEYSQHPSPDAPPRHGPGSSTRRPPSPRAQNPKQPLTFPRRPPPFDSDNDPAVFDSDAETAVDSGSETECEDESDGSGSSGGHAPTPYDERPSSPDPSLDGEGSRETVLVR